MHGTDVLQYSHKDKTMMITSKMCMSSVEMWPESCGSSEKESGAIWISFYLLKPTFLICETEIIKYLNTVAILIMKC